MYQRVTAALTANGSTAAVNVGRGGPLVLAAYGAFGAGTLTFEVSFDGGTTWIAVTGGALSANGYVIVENFPADAQVRGTLAGATAPNVTVDVREL